MDSSIPCTVHRFDGDRRAVIQDFVIAEARVTLEIGEGGHRFSMLCLPQDLDALAVGFLRGEGIVRRREDLLEIVSHPEERRVLLRGDFDETALEALGRRWTQGSGCGFGGTARDFERLREAPLEAGAIVAPSRLCDVYAEFLGRAKLWRQTGGVHACALAGPEGLRIFAEDIGRHNAFDKIMGRAFLDGIPLSDAYALTTGRVSAEIVSKAVASGLPLLASRSAVTDLAVRLAHRAGLTLVGFLRGRRLNVYCGHDRIVFAEDPEAGPC